MRGRRSSCQPTGPSPAMIASTDPPALVGPSPVMTASRRTLTARPSTYRSSHIETDRTKSAVVLGAGLQSAFERAKSGVSAHREDDPLQSAAGLQVAADLLDLDVGRLLQRKAADARAEGHEGQRAGPELIGAGQRRRRRAADDLRR